MSAPAPTLARDALPAPAAPHPLMMVPGPPPPPTVPSGWRTGPPDFVGVGGQRCGTTWWWTVLQGHPAVALAMDATDQAARRRALGQRKELHFFDRLGKVERLDPELYHRHFPRPPGTIAGEWTPRYMYDYWTPAMLAGMAPRARILVMLRDPVQRFLSGIAHSELMAQALGFELDAGAFVAHEHFSRGLYGTQLRNVLRYFDRDQVLVLQYEKCVADVAGQARATFGFLGLDPVQWRPSAETTARPARPAAPSRCWARRPPPRCGAPTDRTLSCCWRTSPSLDAGLWPATTDGW